MPKYVRMFVAFSLALVAAASASVHGQQPAGGSTDKAGGSAPAAPGARQRTAPEERARRAQQALDRALFAEDSPLPVSLVADFKAIQRDRNPDSKQVFPGTLVVKAPDGAEQRIDVRLRTRGHSRRNVLTCAFAPLRIEFPVNPKGTVFEGHKSIKLGTHCRDVDLYEQYVYREYAVYRALNVLTPRSFRARLASVTYTEAGGKTIATRAGLFLEDDDDVARRLEGDTVELKGVGFVNVDRDTMTLAGLFEYMIGNTDVSLVKLHNIVLVRVGTGVVYPVPYDFDYSGVVNARYAIPAKELGLATVRERLYRGPCRTAEEFEKSFARFRETREEVLALYDSVPQLDAGYRKDARSYLGDFYKMIERPSDVKHAFIDGCKRSTM